jgi:hypothetical protein
MIIRIGLAVALLAVAACGSSPSAPPVAGSSGPAVALASPGIASRTQAWLGFAACLRRHGANVPDPTFDQQGNPVWAVSPKSQSTAAIQACASYLQAASIGKTNQAPTAAQLAQETQFARCMRQHGITNFPDPDPQTGAFPNTFDKTSPALQPAMQACRQFAQTGKGG